MTGASAAPREPVEIELKYHLPGPAAGERLLAAGELAGMAALGPIETVTHVDRYVDTAAGALAAAGYAARFRSDGERTLLTLKGLHLVPAAGGRAHRRAELEGPADPAAPVSAWPPSAARDALAGITGPELLDELVTIRQVRRRRHYGRDGAVVELSLDEIEVLEAGRTVDRFVELEVELREGGEAALESLADLLGELEELVPAGSSKLARALAAVGREPLAPADPSPAAAATVPPAAAAPTGALPAAATPPVAAARFPGVTAEDHLAEAGRKVLRFHLARMVLREEGTRAGRPEELKAMRVATRRQRAAWRVFGDAFEPGRTDRHRRRLRAIARDLGAVRDLDVLIEAAEAYAAVQPDAEGAALEPLLRAWRGRREQAREALLRALDSQRHRRWVEEYLAFVAAEGAAVRAVGPTAPHRVRDTMPSRIWGAYEVVRAYEPVMRWADVPTLHELRIAAKWLRYTVEFVREPLGADAGPVIEKVVALQDHLGWLHDADVTAGLARAFLVEHAGELSERESAAIGRYLVDRERELARLRRTVGPAWRGVASPPFRRALGRLVAGL